MFLLLLIKVDIVSEKKRIFKNLIKFFGSHYDKVVFTPLTKIIVVYIIFF